MLYIKRLRGSVNKFYNERGTTNSYIFCWAYMLEIDETFGQFHLHLVRSKSKAEYTEQYAGCFYDIN